MANGIKAGRSKKMGLEKSLEVSEVPRSTRRDKVNLKAPCVLYIGQAFRYSPQNAFCIFNQQIYFII